MFRSLSDEGPFVCWELCGFSDESKSDFWARVCVRSFCRSGKVDVRLLTVKSRVAFLKTDTIPRLDLFVILCLTTLIKKCFGKLRQLWWDLFMDRLWRKATDRELEAFIENRLQEISNNTDIENWSCYPTIFKQYFGTTKKVCDNKLWGWSHYIL